MDDQQDRGSAPRGINGTKLAAGIVIIGLSVAIIGLIFRKELPSQRRAATRPASTLPAER